MSFFKFHKRKTWYFKAGREISLEATGWHQSPHIGFRMDGAEGEVQFHIALFIGVWVTIARLIPTSWYPSYQSTTFGKLPGERAFKIYWFEWALWWNFWMPEDEWNATDPKWRRGSIHFDDLILGKRTVSWDVLDQDQFYLPFFEGCYLVKATKKLLIEKRTRWFTRKSISFEVECGPGVPHEGKGENSWDQGEDYTASISFHESSMPRRYNSTCYDAAMYFWMSCMETRARYGNDKWVPKKFRPLNISVIEQDGIRVVGL